MTNAPADIIKTALDILTTDAREVELVISDGIDVRVRYGTLTGLGTGPVDTITVENYRLRADLDGGIITERTLVLLDEIVSISRA